MGARAHRHLVVPGVGVGAKVLRTTQRATSLAEHLEAFAVDGCGRRKIERQVEQHDFLDPERARYAVGHTRPAPDRAPLARQIDTRDISLFAWHDESTCVAD